MTRRQQLTLVAAILASAIASIDGSVVNVALPAIARDLGGGLVSQQWISNAYLLSLCSLILLGGTLGDIYGERRIFALGVGAFGVFSLACALAPTVGVLIAARALTGAAAALMTPASLAVIVDAFTAQKRGAAIGAWSLEQDRLDRRSMLGGAIVDETSWRWICPSSARRGHAGASSPSCRAAGRWRRLDVTGALLGALGMAGLVFALIEAPRHGWSSPVILVPLCVGVACLAAFVAYERRAKDPMVKVDLFRRRNFAVGNLETLTMYAGLGILSS